MSWTHHSAKNHRTPISPLSTRMVFSDLALWRHHGWSVTSSEREVLALWRHIRRLFLHAQIGTKAIFTCTFAIFLKATPDNPHKLYSAAHDLLFCLFFIGLFVDRLFYSTGCRLLVLTDWSAARSKKTWNKEDNNQQRGTLSFDEFCWRNQQFLWYFSEASPHDDYRSTKKCLYVYLHKS